VVAAQPADKTAEMFLPQLFSLHCFLWFSFQYKFIVQFVLLWLSHPSDKTLTTCMLTKHPLRFLDKVTFSYAAQLRRGFARCEKNRSRYRLNTAQVDPARVELCMKPEYQNGRGSVVPRSNCFQ